MIATSAIATSALERQFQSAVIEYAELEGWRVAHFHDSRRQVRPSVFVGDKQAKGYPDLTLIRERVVWAELKREKGSLTDAQTSWLQTLKAAGQEVYVWKPSQWDEIEQALRTRKPRRTQPP